MKNLTLSLSATLLLSLLPAIASAEEIPAILTRAATSLAPILDGLDPKPEIINSPQSHLLEVKYRTQIFKIHDCNMTGFINPAPVDRIGPGNKGFYLRVAVEPLHAPHQQMETQTGLQEPYWKTDLDVVPIDPQSQIYWILSYNANADPKLLAEIEQALRALKN
ncbi:hypothetical protein BH09VER1_BH09VER1_48670 [soil metagenome]